eukprot:TRINITY_DN7438_c0_g1_i1.p1 TRINITY_DN7438_c0_g1~~TRINITY_DN7438_c0_g1_i1.p1  ORF type:complete len:491 (-),score=132.98 TRINITY_DN7438_c0_g1_i1:194-1666(-)
MTTGFEGNIQFTSPLKPNEKNEQKNGEDASAWSTFFKYFSSHQPKTQQTQMRQSPNAKRSTRNIWNKLPVESSWISALQLSRWDNISGPKVEQIWIGTEELSEETQISIARNTLCGELSRGETETEEVENKFHLLSDLGFTVTSSLFSGCWGSQTTYRMSLSFIVNTAHYQKYLLMHSLVEDRLFHLVPIMKNLLEKQFSSAMVAFTSQLGPYISNLQQVFVSSLPPVISHKTFLSQQTQYPMDFLSRAVTSHLQTHGNTVVIGDNEEKINQFIDSLSIFTINSGERQKSSHCKEIFIADLAIQGIIKHIPMDEEIIQSILPTTLVDISRLDVKQTPPFHEYTILRKEYFSSQLLGPKESAEADNAWFAQEGLFRIVKTGAPCVEKILNEVFQYPSNMRLPFITHSIKLLVRKSINLIKYVQAEIERCNPRQLDANTVKKIRVDMELSIESDFYLLLGIAEKLFPGIYVMLAGDPAFFIELKFIELFESF